MAKTRCKCAPKPCRKRRGSPRFSSTCKAKFRDCMRGELKSTGSMRSAGKACMRVLHQCSARSYGEHRGRKRSRRGRR